MYSERAPTRTWQKMVGSALLRSSFSFSSSFAVSLIFVLCLFRLCSLLFVHLLLLGFSSLPGPPACPDAHLQIELNLLCL
mmetsp:Transcript_63142/g.133290  ORF Transcript_63142/g.133290 Transcript_63142/m.133290 type:complete len:80 (-) Transcript_63142:148-387(-)